MEKIKIYLDTSVIGGCFDKEFEKESNQIINEIKAFKKIGVVSEVIINELNDSPFEVRNYFESYKNILELITINEKVDFLSEMYLKERIVTQKYKNDSLHIAYATVYDVDALVSWNFKHIVNLDKIIQFNAVNINNGYKPLQICSPREAINQNE